MKLVPMKSALLREGAFLSNCAIRKTPLTRYGALWCKMLSLCLNKEKKS